MTARVGVDERTVQRWASGATRIPARVALVLELEAERAASGWPSEAARRQTGHRGRQGVRAV